MELKPCPFCGGKAEVAPHEHYDDSYSDDCLDICCYTKDCHLEFGADFHFEKNEVDKLIDKWNHRPSPWIKVEDWDGKPQTINVVDKLGYVGIYGYTNKSELLLLCPDVTHVAPIPPPIPPVEGE